MVRSIVAAAAAACALSASPRASAQNFRLSIGVGSGPAYGHYSSPYSYGYSAPRFYDQRYYGDWRDYRGDYRYPGYIRAPDPPYHHHHHHCPPYWDGRYYIMR